MALTVHDVGSVEPVGVHTGDCAEVGVLQPWVAYALPSSCWL